jgi:hypothetical protein
MTEILKLSKLIDKHGVTEVKVRCGRIKTRLDSQWLTALQLGAQLALNQNFIGAALDQRQLLVNRLHSCSFPVSVSGWCFQGDKPYNIAYQLQAAQAHLADSRHYETDIIWRYKSDRRERQKLATAAFQL